MDSGDWLASNSQRCELIFLINFDELCNPSTCGKGEFQRINSLKAFDKILQRTLSMERREQTVQTVINCKEKLQKWYHWKAISENCTFMIFTEKAMTKYSNKGNFNVPEGQKYLCVAITVHGWCINLDLDLMPQTSILPWSMGLPALIPETKTNLAEEPTHLEVEFQGVWLVRDS